MIIINGISTGAYVLNKNLVIAMMVVREREVGVSAELRETYWKIFQSILIYPQFLPHWSISFRHHGRLSEKGLLELKFGAWLGIIYMKKLRLRKAFQTTETAFSKASTWEGAWCVCGNWKLARLAAGKEGKSNEICGWRDRCRPHSGGLNMPR